MGGTGERLVDIAEANGTTPKAIAALVRSVAREVTPQEAAARLQPDPSPARFPRPYSTLCDEATRLGLDPEGLIDILSGTSGEA